MSSDGGDPCRHLSGFCAQVNFVRLPEDGHVSGVVEDFVCDLTTDLERELDVLKSPDGAAAAATLELDRLVANVIYQHLAQLTWEAH